MTELICFYRYFDDDNGIDIPKHFGEDVADKILAALNGQSIPKERLLKLLTREDIKAANRKGFDPLVYEGMRKIIQELREAIGSMEGKDTTVTDYITKQARMANK